MSMAVLGFQLFIIATLAAARIFGRRALDAAAIGWTLFTLLVAFGAPFLLLQLVVIWVSVGALSSKDTAPTQRRPAAPVPTTLPLSNRSAPPERRGVTAAELASANAGPTVAEVRSVATLDDLADRPTPPIAGPATVGAAPTPSSDTLADRVRARRIPYLVHFTRAENLRSILRHGLCPVETLEARGLAFSRNDWQRLDGHIAATSLSIAHPNERLFYRWRRSEPMTQWTVLLLSPDILTTKRCAFYAHNAADARMREAPDDRDQVVAFELMFAEEDEGEGRSRLLPCDPTDLQAEVLVFDAIEPPLVQACLFSDHATFAAMRDAIGERHAAFCPDRTGLFGLRDYRRAGRR